MCRRSIPRIAATFALLVSILLIACCSLPGLNTGSLKISLVAVPLSKTIVPTVEPCSYRISFTGPTKVDDILLTTTTTVSIELAVGTWSVAVVGYDENVLPIASGSMDDLRITTGATTAATILIGAIAAGSGTIDLKVTWPAEEGIDSYTTSINGSVVAGGSIAGDPEVSYRASHDAGDYRILFTLSSNNAVQAYVWESVQVYQNLTSSGVIALSSSDFTQAPVAPTDLAITASYTSLALHWKDNSAVEIGYAIERSIDNSDWTEISDSLDANATSYLDSDVTAGKTYRYRVRAFNQHGYSQYSDIASGSLVPLPGNLSITITSVSPPDETITFSQDDHVEVSQESTLTVSVNETFDSYSWGIDGSTMGGAGGKSITIDCHTLLPGVHTLVCFVTRNSRLYSRMIRFLVFN